MPWTQFWDMHSGGRLKEKWSQIFIEAPEQEARSVFYSRFGHSPDRVSCTCCGSDYSITEHPSLRHATAFQRGCKSLKTPLDKRGLYKRPDDPWWSEHYYLEAGEEAEAERRGWTLSKLGPMHEYQTLDQYLARKDVKVIRANEIKPEERTVPVPEQGYVWQG